MGIAKRKEVNGMYAISRSGIGAELLVLVGLSSFYMAALVAMVAQYVS